MLPYYLELLRFNLNESIRSGVFLSVQKCDISHCRKSEVGEIIRSTITFHEGLPYDHSKVLRSKTMNTNINPPITLQRYFFFGTLLIWLGVLIWTPFIVLQIAGQQPSFLLFLPFHLIGVIGGARLRSFARKQMGLPSPKRNPLQIIGSILIVLGILTWVPYFYLKAFTQTPVNVMNFLPFHLTGVLGGVLLLAINHLSLRKNLDNKAITSERRD